MSDTQKPIASAIFLLNKIQSKQLSPSQLTVHQRRICVRHLMGLHTYTQQEVGAIVGIHETTVHRMWKKIKDQNTYLLDEIDERSVATDLINIASVASAKLFRKGKEEKAWAVQRECVEALQALGFISKKPIEVKFQGEMTLAEILKIAADPGHKDENFLGKPDPGPTHSTNGSSRIPH